MGSIACVCLKLRECESGREKHKQHKMRKGNDYKKWTQHRKLGFSWSVIFHLCLIFFQHETDCLCHGEGFWHLQLFYFTITDNHLCYLYIVIYKGPL